MNTTGQISGIVTTTSSGAEVETKTCSKCKTEKPLTEFYKDKTKKNGHRSACRPCINAERKAYYEANREKIMTRKKAWCKVNPEKVKAQNKAYYEANREKINARKKAYRQTPRGKFFSYKDQAKKTGIEFLLTEEQAIEMIKKPCTYCGKPGLSGIDRIDSNGVYTIENCEPCCGTCNNRKGTKSKEVFLEEIKEGKWDQ